MYLEVEERRERRPGVEQKMSVGRAVIRRFSFISRSLGSLSWKSWEVVRESWESREDLAISLVSEVSELLTNS